MSDLNGNGFVIDELLNMIVSFEFPFEGHVLKGRWYKYKTTTPNYVRGIAGKVRGLQEQALELTQKITTTKTGDPELLRLLKERDEVEDRLQRTPYDWMADGLVEWNATGRGKEPLPISVDTLNTFPLLFLEKLHSFFVAERLGQNPTLPTS